ncbi:MAG: rod shape-determining protein MreD [Betaproteobacteria bacterium]|nr:rod shape-determining protein MreD [Betaproteobacteria bacterium]MBU6513181.1 rod shape-determining protein MreD [Betaproteobacteria bacterium]MDE1955701.1 rod shape-determining protein MreD [Betaproteobacteria bacterium]MDE2151027.1 rod shape-determining protein MreD [Betaproteobacteria bacterium]MDE2477591.1 rod shape-determining protein MreD [Betaproteobacteria bacterium]
MSSLRGPRPSPGDASARGEVLLLAAQPWFIWVTLVAALVLEFMPLGRRPWLPDLLAMTLVFWVVHQPRRVGIGAGFVFGLLIDAQHAALLGEHALAYSLLAFFAVMLHRRLVWFSLPQQALQILPLFAAARLLEFLVAMMAGASPPGLSYAAAPLLQAALWPLLSWLLLAPQRRAPSPDENRPL